MALDNDCVKELYNTEGWDLNELLNSNTFNQCDYYTYDTLSDINYKIGNLKILQLNIHSFNSKKTQLKSLLNNLTMTGHEIDIILLCETLMNDLNKQQFKIPGYKLIEYAHRENKKGGAVAIFVLKKI